MLELFEKIFGGLLRPLPVVNSLFPQRTPRKTRQLERRNIFIVRSILAGIAVLGAIWAFGIGDDLLEILAKPVVFAIAIGGLVGGVEILGRYRYAPLRAVFTLSGCTYVVINLLAAWAAYYLIQEFNVLGTTAVAKDLTHVLLAGFGSLVFMRSSFFKIRVGESDIGIGPSVVLDTLLLVADRGVDRREAVKRAQDIASLVSEVSDTQLVAKMLTKYCLALMQNVDDKTTQQVTEAIDKIMADAVTPEQIKLDIAALQLGNVVGPDVLEAALDALGNRLQSSSGPKVLPTVTSSVPVQPENTKAESIPSKEDLVAEIASKRKE